MTAVTADQLAIDRATSDVIEDVLPITTNNTIYLGALLCFVTGTGRVASATAATSRLFAGEAIEGINETGGPLTAWTGNTAGTVKVRFRWNHELLLAVRTATRTFSNLGKTVTVSDNATVGGTGVGTAAVRVTAGVLASFLSQTDKTKAFIKLTRAPGSAAAT
jgi:hypothetical protein